MSFEKEIDFQVLRVMVPQMLIIILLIAYVLFGSAMFVVLDENLAKENFTDIILFSFTTIATIGYLNLHYSIFTVFDLGKGKYCYKKIFDFNFQC